MAPTVAGVALSAVLSGLAVVGARVLRAAGGRMAAVLMQVGDTFVMIAMVVEGAAQQVGLTC
jgi:hypothetical protein